MNADSGTAEGWDSDVILTPEDEAWVRAIAERAILQWQYTPEVAETLARQAVVQHLVQNRKAREQTDYLEGEQALREWRETYEHETARLAWHEKRIKHSEAQSRLRFELLEKQESPDYFGKIEETSRLCTLADRTQQKHYDYWDNLVPRGVAVMQGRWEFAHKILRSAAVRGALLEIVGSVSGVSIIKKQARRFITRHGGVAPVQRYLSLKPTVRVVKPDSIIVPTDRPATPELQLSWSGLIAAMQDQIEELSQ